MTSRGPIRLTTDRLVLREMTLADSSFILNLLNDPGFIQNIGDRGVRTLEQAEKYITEKFIPSYSKFRFGFYLVAPRVPLKGSPETPEESLGICGLIKRDVLPDVDLGYAFLAPYRGKGYATESSRAVVEYARMVLKLKKLLAVTLPTNAASIRLLENLGMKHEGYVRLGSGGPENKLFGMKL